MTSTSPSQRPSRPGIRFWTPLLAVGVMLGVLIWTRIRLGNPPGPDYFCDAETMVEEGGKFHFAGKGRNFRNGQTQSRDEAYSGNYSSKVWRDNEYGIGIEIADLRPGETFEVSVYRKSPGSWGQLVVETSWGSVIPVVGAENGKAGEWQKIKTSVTVPPWNTRGKIKIYCFNNREEPAYFDDLSITRSYQHPQTQLHDFSARDLPTLDFTMSESDLAKISKAREQALRDGVLMDSGKDWIKIQIKSDTAQYNARVRLKGDWTDHLLGNKWSFRVELADSQAWNRMLTFSLHNPASRHFLDEWVLHQWFMKEDVLTTRYGFVQLKINGENRGIFAFEEHFNKNLLEYQHRREGVIVRFNEEGYWEMMLHRNQAGLDFEEGTTIIESSTIDAFGMKGVRADTLLGGQFSAAQQLMQQYREGNKKISEVFDMDRMARYFAILDLSQGYHGLMWHNQRFYFNPVTQKLEPIGFDGYTPEGVFLWTAKPFLGHQRNLRNVMPEYRMRLVDPFFQDTAFVRLYVQNLERMSKKDYQQDFFVAMSDPVQKWEKLFCQEWPNYAFDPNFIQESSAFIHELLYPAKSSSVKAWQQSAGELYVENYHCLPVIIKGYAAKKTDKMSALLKPVYINAFPGFIPSDAVTIKISGAPTLLYFEVPGLDSLFRIEIHPWEPPVPKVPPAQQLFAGAKVQDCELYTVQEKQVIFRKGKHDIRSSVIIPEGYTVMFNAGTTLNFINGASFISRSPVMARGTTEQPVLITSTDKSAGGFSVLDPGMHTKSELWYVTFSDFNTLHRNGWNLTGAVTFYETDVTLRNCTFLNSQCEDALNLIRCQFSMKYCIVAHTASDGFDADFCQGKVENSEFAYTVNDGMDFSGSKIKVRNCYAHHNGDKGVSVGEESDVEISELRVENSNTGIASKDLSTAKADRVFLTNVKTGLALYQKKTEYGPSLMEVTGLTLNGVEKAHEIQPGCILKLDGKEIKSE